VTSYHGFEAAYAHYRPFARILVLKSPSGLTPQGNSATTELRRNSRSNVADIWLMQQEANTIRVNAWKTKLLSFDHVHCFASNCASSVLDNSNTAGEFASQCPGCPVGGGGPKRRPSAKSVNHIHIECSFSRWGNNNRGPQFSPTVARIVAGSESHLPHYLCLARLHLLDVAHQAGPQFLFQPPRLRFHPPACVCVCVCACGVEGRM